jgi:hypothetical protein
MYQKFWQKFGLTPDRVAILPYQKFDFMVKAMNLEWQYEAKEMKRQSKHG